MGRHTFIILLHVHHSNHCITLCLLLTSRTIDNIRKKELVITLQNMGDIIV